MEVLYLLSVALIVVASLVIYFLSASLMREKSYEEMLQEQRARVAVAEVKQPKAKAEKTPKKQKKTKTEKLKPTGTKAEEKQALDTGTDDNEMGPHVEFEPDPEVIVNEGQPRARKRSLPGKPILLKRDSSSEVPPINLPLVDVINHFEDLHPLDDLELKKSGPKEDGRRDAAKKKKPKSGPVPSAEPEVFVSSSTTVASAVYSNGLEANEVEAVAEVAEVKEVVNVAVSVNTLGAVPVSDGLKDGAGGLPQRDSISATPSSTPGSTPTPPESVTLNQGAAMQGPAASKKKKKTRIAQERMSNGDIVAPGSLLPLISRAALSHEEIQALIDELLNKQVEEAESWVQRGGQRVDTVPSLRKALEEVEKELVQEREMTRGTDQRMQKLRLELQTERAKLSETMNKKEGEVRVLRSEVENLKLRAKKDGLQLQ
ncbi:unnamed protein product, partial [Cyprideis torosa]